MPLTADDRHQDSNNIPPVDEMILRLQPKVGIPNKRNPKRPRLRRKDQQKSRLKVTIKKKLFDQKYMYNGPSSLKRDIQDVKGQIVISETRVKRHNKRGLPRYY